MIACQHPPDVCCFAKIGDADISSGFDELVKSMKAGEEANFELRANKAFGVTGSETYHVPPHANIKVRDTIGTNIVSYVHSSV